MHKSFWKRATGLLLAGALLVGLAACVGGESQAESAPGSTEGIFQAGTYTAAAQGMNGAVNVEVVFSADAIESVQVLEHQETDGISDPAIEQIPAGIVDNQSLAVDAVAGATITSQAILDAVRECVVQAGADPASLNKAVATEAEDISLEANVVVVGSGIAGLAAAIEAADNGASVVLVEKMGTIGGASTLSGGEVLAAGTHLQERDGIEDSWQALADYWVMKGEGRINESMVRSIAEMAPENILWMEENGVEFMESMQTPTSMPWADPRRTHKTADGTGAGFTTPLAASAESKGVTILTSSPATGLLVEEGTVVGIEGTTASGGRLEVRADSVILATGGYENNPELMEEYSPLIGGDLPSAIGEAHLGDGLLWARELGSPIVAGGGGIVLAINYFTFTSADLDPYGIFLYVDAEGNRFMDESEYWFSRSRKMLDLPGVMYWTIVDSKAEAIGVNVEGAIEAGAGFVADSIEELGELLAMDNLAATVDAYNKACAAGVDSEFGKDADKLTAVDEGPFYAIYSGYTANTGSFGGPQINDSCQVLDADGNPIPGLYAAGEVANGEIFYKEYPCSGSAIQSYMAMGRIAGEAAASA